MAALSVEQRRAIVFGAATVYQRVAAFTARFTAAPGATPATPGAPAAEDEIEITPDANATLQSWSQVFSPGDRDAFLRRLSWDGLGWTMVARALSSVGPDGQELEPRPEHDWTVWLDLLLDAATEVAAELDPGPLVEVSYFDARDEPPFIELAVPALRAARASLTRMFPEVFARFSDPARRAMERQLLKEISAFGERTIFDLFRQLIGAQTPAPGKAGKADEPPGPADERYRAFVRTMLEDGLPTFFVAYPVLARATARLMEKWVDAMGDLSRRLEADRAEITGRLGEGVDPGYVSAIAPALSDPHNGRRRVALLTFDSGLRVVYKPRDVGIERALSDFLEWADDRGLKTGQRVLRVIERPGYGWVEFAEHDAFQSADEVRRYYHRAGALTIIAHLLGSNDLHMENVVATRSGPVLVDPESMLQPGRSTSGAEGGPCVATGFITFAEGGADGERYETGGLRGTGLRGTARARRAWKSIRSDGLHFADEHEFQAPSANRVVLDGVVQRVEDHRDALLDGFTAAYRFFVAMADEVTAADGPLRVFHRRRVRILFRPTNQYAVVQDVLAAPRYQASGVIRSYGLDSMARPFALDQTRPVAWPIAVEERNALENLDIPHFTVGTDSVMLEAGGRPVSDRFFTRPGLDLARERCRALSEDDLNVQLEWITRSFSESATSHFRVEAVAPAASGLGDAEDLGRLHVALAEWIGREMLERAVPEGEALTWRLHAPGVTTRAAEPYYLDGGSLGPALFLAALSERTGDRSWADAARRASAPARAFASRADLGASVAGSPLGIGSGLGSLVYGLLSVGKLLGDDSYADLAARVARCIKPAGVEADREMDVLGGSAGAILALLALHDEVGGPFLDAAAACGDHLVDAQVHTPWGSNWLSRDRRLLAGFAHGAAGIAYALIRLYQATGTRAYLDAALRGHRYERAVFSPLHRNWPLIRSAGHLPGNVAVMMTAWCHGAPGIGLARSLVYDTVVGEDPEVADEIKVALGTTAGLAGNAGDHLCCGNVGRCEVLFTAGRKLGKKAAIDAATALVAKVEQRALRRKRFQFVSAGFEYVVFDATFFHGLSGIGYQLLRLSAPSRLPSVLAFEGRVAAGAGVAAVGSHAGA